MSTSAAHTEPPDDLGHYMQAVSELRAENERLRAALARVTGYEGAEIDALLAEYDRG